MRSAFATLAQYRYTILAILSLLMIAQMVQPHLDLVPIEHEWLSGLLLFLTMSAWMGMACLIGVVAPIGRNVMKYVYSTLAVLCLTILAIIGWIFVGFSMSIVSSLAFWFLGLTVLVWLIVAALIGAISSDDYSTKAYLILVVFPLISLAGIVSVMVALFGPIIYVGAIGAVLYVLGVPLMLGAISWRRMEADKPRPRRQYIIVALKSLGISVVVFTLMVAGLLSVSVMPEIVGFVTFLLLPWIAAAVFSVPGTALIGTLKHPHRNIVVAAIGLWAMIAVMGWYWVWTMGDGLDGLTNGERVVAERSLSKAHCKNRINVGINSRAIAYDTGFAVDRRTWWRFPISCAALPRWID